MPRISATRVAFIIVIAAASTGSVAAVMSAVAAVHGATLRASDGICAETPEDCIRNIARIGINGMSQTVQEILHIMTRMNAKQAVVRKIFYVANA